MLSGRRQIVREPGVAAARCQEDERDDCHCAIEYGSQRCAGVPTDSQPSQGSEDVEVQDEESHLEEQHGRRCQDRDDVCCLWVAEMSMDIL